MKLNNKGFMLAEIIITSVTVMVTLVALYATFSKIYTGFNKLNNYEHVDAMYAARGMYDLMINENVINEYVSDIENINNSNYKIYEKNNGSINSYYEKYKIMNSVLVKYDKNSLYDGDTDISDLYDATIGEELKDYAKYLSTSLDFGDNSASYLIIMELSEDCTGTGGNYDCKEDNTNNYFGYYKVP